MKVGGGSKIPKILTTWFMDDPRPFSTVGSIVVDQAPFSGAHYRILMLI